MTSESGRCRGRLARYVDAPYPMVYPSRLRLGEYNIDNASPAETVTASLRDFKRQLRGRKAKLIPWLQDFSCGRTYTLDDVKAQIDAARAARTGGSPLWNAAGVYTPGALAYAASR